MRRNVASQVIGAQMVSASDGSAFTGSVTCHVTGNGGTQAAGSVGSGACTHEGNGFHTYAPAQAETNYAHVAFTFTGTGAIPVTVQLYPMDYNSSGQHTIGGTASGAITAAALASDAITEIQSGLATAANLATAAGYIDTEVAAIKAVTDNLPNSGTLSSLATAAALTTVDTVVDAIQAKTDQLTFTSGNVDANIEMVIGDQITASSSKETNWGGTP